MAVTLVGVDNQVIDRNAVTVTIPANVQPGDFIVLFASQDNTYASTFVGGPPEAWTAVENETLWTRVATAGDAGASVTVEWSAISWGSTIAHLRVYRGVDTSTVVWSSVFVVSGSSTPILTIPASVSPGDLVLMIGWATIVATVGGSGSTYAPRVAGFSTGGHVGQGTQATGVLEALSAPDARASVQIAASSGSEFSLRGIAMSARPAPVVSLERVRSSVSEDAGSILNSASLNAVDASVAEAFLLDVALDPQETSEFVEALDPLVAAARYYPIPRQSTEFLNDYSGETILSRMARVYPDPIFGKVADLGLTTFNLLDGDGNTIGSAATAQNVISHVFSEWAADHAWFAYEPVPDLRLKVESPTAAGIATPSDYSSDAELGRAYAEVIQFAQDEDSRKTMRQILDELLSPFPGTVVRANASGALEIVPVYGPDASNTPVVTLTDKDAYTVTEGQPSPQGVINKWTFNSQPYVLTEDGGLLNQSWFQVCSNNFPSGNLYATGTGEDISSDDPYPGGWNPKAWSPQSGRIPDSPNGIKLTDSGGVKQVTIDYKYSGGSGSVSASDITLTDIPMDGSTVLAIEADGPSIGSLHIEISGRYDAATRSVYLWPSGRNDYENANGTHVFRINLLDATDVWQAESTTVSGTYSLEEEEENPLPGSPVTASVAAYGTREKTVDITGWGITSADQLQRMARAAVFEAIQPTLIRTVEQSVWRAFPVKFSHMGSVIELPNGEQGRLINRTYADDFGTNFGPGSMSSTVKVEVIDQDGDGVIDVDTEYLLLDDGSAFVLDDGTQAVGG